MITLPAFLNIVSSSVNFGSALNIKPALNYAVEVDTSIFSGIVFSMKIPSGMRIVFEGQIDGPWLPVTFQNQTTLADETTTLTSANYRGDVSRYAKVRFRAATVFDVAGTVTGVVFNTINAVEVSNEVTVTGALTATVAGVATAANQTTQITAVNLTNTEIGATNETAAPTDTSTSGLNGLLKRLLQRVTSLIGLFPTSIGAKTSAGSLSVVPATDATFPVTGTFWPITQPVSGTFWQATQPVSGTFWQATQPVSGSVSVSSFPASSHYDTGAYAASGVIKASAGTIVGYAGYNSGPDQFILLFNLTAVPANGTAPSCTPLKVSAGANFFFNIQAEMMFGTGICWSNSSTATTKTIGAADVWLTAVYR